MTAHDNARPIERRPASAGRDPSLRHEHALARAGYRAIAGVDEAGRGAWAGPLVAAAVILPSTVGRRSTALAQRLRGVRDSKLLTPARREELAVVIESVALAIGVGVVPAAELDQIGLGAANREAFRRAVLALAPPPTFLLLDAFPLPGLDLPQQALVRGDRHCLSIAAASIVAKVTRDRFLRQLEELHPLYGFARHKGYGTSLHQQALLRHGPCIEHRSSFAPLRALDRARKTVS